MDRIDLEELERLLANATPGEWQHHMSHVYGPDPDRELVCQFRNGPWLVSDRDLIVALRNTAEALIAEVEELRAALVNHNDVLRSAYQIAARKGAQTEWDGFTKRAGSVLHFHHEEVEAARAALEGKGG